MKTSTTIVSIALAMFLQTAYAQDRGSGLQAQSHKPGMMVAQMMGGGMMGGGMMGRSTKDDQAASISVNPEHADELLAYIRKNNLTCTSCHSVSANGVGPSFAAIAAKYADQNNATSTLENHIANGFGRMPGGMTSKSKAAILAKMILDLAKSE